MARADDLIDRRSLRRKVSFWRVVAVLAVLLAVGVAVLFNLEKTPIGNQIARVSIEGMITEDQPMLELLETLKEEESVRAVIVRIDSPGGTTVGGEALYEAVRALAKTKPVAAEVGTLAASAGYMVAVATDHIVARRTSIVGSIGVLFQYANASELLDTIGVEVNAVKSSPIKAEPSPFGPPPPEALAVIDALIMDTYDWFRAIVQERRNLSPSELNAVADAAIFSGRQGLDRKLVDAIGSDAVVRQWLEGERDVPAGLEIVDREPEEETAPFDFLDASMRSAGAFFGVSEGTLPVSVRALKLDGLLSLWQPSN
ncbi:signal peptide peptidase SppA [Fulvimarina sp. 2208YS6-2-32]|uniref:Signal peptide peptidase SppA n=1 Tax=Fulvimarina uroteuthidis TaxID=3098149 RepID=A0ABU5HYB1_9HYPH|nr:signal peptide peptidase SppA [Fulvimarina sp. 2208YS6-2-32]MDY8108121.1 signal peptide peptidase SppA [Fulvimarina sp. 2208YS6-2-32]